LSLACEGAERHAGAAVTVLPSLTNALAHLPPNVAGLRIAGIAALQPLLAADGPIGTIAAAALGPGCRPVRAILFDKTPVMNWSLAWHQDRTISVAERVDVDGFGPWTLKHGMPHVSPPYELLARMVTVRVHLDDVPATNAPLLVAVGSHRLGRVAVTEIEAAVHMCGIRACLAIAGDIWLYATPILHASEAATQPRSRRVLQVDYSVDALPGGLQWSGV
jgi:ectoine hydroxylase-related dioxygenase (phytanoyl-CoA dioxygenase family)